MRVLVKDVNELHVLINQNAFGLSRPKIWLHNDP
jgi:hypothetical protein